MNGWVAYVSLSIAVTWGGVPMVVVSPAVETWTCRPGASATLEPSELSWTPGPDGGLAVRSVASVDGYARGPAYCAWRPR